MSGPYWPCCVRSTQHPRSFLFSWMELSPRTQNRERVGRHHYEDSQHDSSSELKLNTFIAHLIVAHCVVAHKPISLHVSRWYRSKLEAQNTLQFLSGVIQTARWMDKVGSVRPSVFHWLYQVNVVLLCAQSVWRSWVVWLKAMEWMFANQHQQNHWRRLQSTLETETHLSAMLPWTLWWLCTMSVETKFTNSLEM